jgi:hypothetical protein
MCILLIFKIKKNFINLALDFEIKSSHIYSAKANRIEPKSCSGLVLHFKLDSFVVIKEVHGANKRPCLNLKTRPRFCPVSLSLYMIDPKKCIQINTPQASTESLNAQ